MFFGTARIVYSVIHVCKPHAVHLQVDDVGLTPHTQLDRSAQPARSKSGVLRWLPRASTQMIKRPCRQEACRDILMAVMIGMALMARYDITIMLLQ